MTGPPGDRTAGQTSPEDAGPPADDSGSGRAVRADGNVTIVQGDHYAARRDQTIVHGDQILHMPPESPAAVRCPLPPDTAAFTGRDVELRTITTAVTGAAAGGALAIHATNGMPGVGKTALVVHAAHRLADQYPDGQLFLDLHAHTPGRDPTSPADALAVMLTADGVDPRYLPETLDGQITLWRDRLATKKILLVLDNVASSTQISDLLPGHRNCLVLITSRRHLGDLPGAVGLIALDILSPAAARAMFQGLAPRAASDALADIDELVSVAGYLPLAISLLAKVYTRHRAWTMADLLAETRTTLLKVTAEHATIAAAFDLSYQHLPASRQRFFRCLGLHPGLELDPYAAAALAGVPPTEAVDHLDALHGDNLLTENGHRRYAMHDLIRLYVRDLAATDLLRYREQGVERLLDYYQHTASLAASYLVRQTRPVDLEALPIAGSAGLPELRDFTGALAWMRAERANLLACLAHTGDARRIVNMAGSLAELLRLDGPWSEAVTVHTAAAHMARDAGDRLGHANALSDLGTVQFLTDDQREAGSTLEEALRLYQDLGNKLGQANALEALGVVRQYAGDYPGALSALREALNLHRGVHDRLGEAYALINLAGALRVTADFPGAEEAGQQALTLYRTLSNPRGEAAALNHLGTVRRVAGDLPGAADALHQALELDRRLGNPLGVAYALINLAIVHRIGGDAPTAVTELQEALTLCRDLGDRIGEANALTYLGVAQRVTGDHAGAEQSLQEALELFRDVENRGGEVEALNEIGTLHRLGNDLDRAKVCHRQALVVCRAC